MSNSPFVSVVMPVFNGAAWLRESVESILEQNFGNFELIIVDDGSTDETPLILKALAETDGRVHLLHKPNSGVADSLNLGVQQASGQWICRLDADDISEIDRIETQVAFAATMSSAVLIGSDMISIDAAGLPLKRYFYPTEHKQLLKNLLCGGKFFPHSSAFFKKDAFLAVGGYRPRISKAEDHDLWMRLAQIGSIHSIAMPLVRYRLHDAQVSYLDKGMRQAMDKTIAIISYQLCLAGRPDPVNQTEKEFREYKAWIDSEYVRHRINDIFLLSTRISAARRSNGLSGLVRTITAECLHDPELCTRFVLKRLGLATFEKRTARRWLEVSQRAKG